MPREFCDHLHDYGANWIRAEAAYRALTGAVDRVRDQGASDDRLDHLEVALGDWEYEVTQLRQRFVNLVRQGAVGLPEDTVEPEEGGATPTCSRCGFAIPRLTWPAWDPRSGAGNGPREAGLPKPQPAA